jgi:site-specific DNA-methyltransferase (adenine-specific)
MEQRCKINLYNMDNMEFMKDKPDKYYDLAIVDPPYGIGEGLKSRGMGTSAMAGNYTVKEWDKETPTADYFKQLFRVSKNQIIWGANYMTEHIPPSMGWIFWDKDSSGDFSDGELAYSSFDRALKKIKVTWMGMRQQDMKNKETRIHPTQKPVALYKWLLTNYAKPGDTILDTHFGSLSHGIACWDLGFDLDACELDKEYFDAGSLRLEQHKRQLKMF